MKDKKKYVVLVVLASFCMVAFGCGKGSEAGENKIEAYYQEVKDSDVSYENGVCYVNSQILLTAEKGVSERAIRRLVKKQGGNIVGYISISNDYQIEFEDEKTYDQICKIIEEWKDNSQIADVSLNYAVRNEPDSIDYTKDPWLDDKNAKDTSGSVWSESEPDGNNWWAEAIWMPSVWEMDVEFSPVKVGIYDSMFDVDNDDLNEAFVKLWNNPEDDNGNCAVSTLYDNAVHKSEVSNCSHGTHVAGIIAADAENDFGIAGVSQNAELYGYSYKSESGDHETTGRWGDVFEVKYVIALMLNEGVKVINFSIGWEELLVAAQHGVPTALETLQYVSSSYERFLKDCLEAGYDFLIVKSAGNENGNNWIPCEASEQHPFGYMTDPAANDDTEYDAKYDMFGAIEDETMKSHILIVGAVENHVDYYETAYFSTEGERVDVYAPGVNILSTLPSDQIGMKDGTSMAAPIVTGIVSLIWGINPDLSAEQVADIVQASVNISAFDSESVSNLFHKVETTPIVNAYFAVQLAAETAGNGESVNSAGIITGMAYTKDVDDNLVRLENVNVTIADSAGNIVDTCVTSSLNGYDFVLPTGTYTIQAELEDYETKRKEVTLESGSVLNVDFEMERSAMELTDYYDDLNRLVSILGLGKDEYINYEYGNYESDHTWIQLYNSDFIVRNKNPLITAYGISIGDSLEKALALLSTYGIYVTLDFDSGSDIYLWDTAGAWDVVQITLSIDDSTGEVTEWSVCNWPEGEEASYYTNILSEAKSKNVTEFEEWQSEYISYIFNDYCDNYDHVMAYHLVFIDDDNIPELYITYDTIADGSKVVSFTESGIIEQEVYWSAMSYLEKTGMLRDSGGKMGTYHDIIYELKNGKFQEIAAGKYCDKDKDNPQIDEDGDYIFNYYWNGTQVSESEYQNYLNNVFPTDKEISPWENSDGVGLWDIGAEIACFPA